MKRVKRKKLRLTRKQRIVRNLICSVLAVFLMWQLTGARRLTVEGAFRLMEKTQLLGPSEIVYQTEDEKYTYLFGETDHGYISGTFQWRLYGWSSYESLACFWEKSDEVTLITYGVDPFLSMDWDGVCPMLLFCEDDRAVRGEAVITITEDGALNHRDFDEDKTYTVSFEQVAEGILSGALRAETEADRSWESLVERLMLENLGTFRGEIDPVKIRLYDENGQLILEKEIEYSFPGFSWRS